MPVVENWKRLERSDYSMIFLCREYQYKTLSNQNTRVLEWAD